MYSRQRFSRWSDFRRCGRGQKTEKAISSSLSKRPQPLTSLPSMILDPPLPAPPTTPSLPSSESEDPTSSSEEPAPRQASPPASPVRILAAPLPSPSSPRSIIGTSSIAPRQGVPGLLHLTPGPLLRSIPSTAAPPPSGPSVLHQAQPSPGPPSSSATLIPPTPPQQVNGLPPPNGSAAGVPALVDSITLGQLKAAAVVAKPKVSPPSPSFSLPLSRLRAHPLIFPVPTPL